MFVLHTTGKADTMFNHILSLTFVGEKNHHYSYILIIIGKIQIRMERVWNNTISHTMEMENTGTEIIEQNN